MIGDGMDKKKKVDNLRILFVVWALITIILTFLIVQSFYITVGIFPKGTPGWVAQEQYTLGRIVILMVILVILTAIGVLWGISYRSYKKEKK